MNKKDYQKPTMNVVQLQHQTQILAGSEPKTLSGPNNSNDGSQEDDWYDLE